MRIQEIADTTGLSKKAINLYEKKGLLQVIRDENGYRCYTQEHVRILMRIKILRRMDVSLADIEQLLQEKNMQLLDMQKEQLEKKLAQCELQNLYMQRIAALLEEEHTELLQSADREMEEAWEEVQELQPDKRNVSSFIVICRDWCRAASSCVLCYWESFLLSGKSTGLFALYGDTEDTCPVCKKESVQ